MRIIILNLFVMYVLDIIGDPCYYNCPPFKSWQVKPENRIAKNSKKVTRMVEDFSLPKCKPVNKLSVCL